MPASQTSVVVNGGSMARPESEQEAMAAASQHRVSEYLAKDGGLFQRLNANHPVRDRTKAYRARASDTARDVDNRLKT
ncbi:hypothetical protein EsH8_I_000504 [Colletotrichum jinshuiense]